MEELIIKKIESGIRGIRLGTRKPEDVKVGYYLNKLKPLNIGMYEEYMERYGKVYKFYKSRHKV